MNTAVDAAFRLRKPMVTLWRGPQTLQIGVDDDAVILEAAPTGIVQALELLQQPCTVKQLAHGIPGLGTPWARWLCAHLSSVGVLTIDPPPPVFPVSVLGHGPLAAAVANALGRVGISVRQASAASVADTTHPDHLVVVAAATAEPDRVDLARLQVACRPHLVVRVEPSRAVVGPLVEPGKSACVHCDDLARAHLDPAWVWLLSQLTQRRVSPDPGLLAWAVSTTVNHIRAWQQGATPESRDRCVAITVDGFRQHEREIVRHPDCGCGAAG